MRDALLNRKLVFFIAVLFMMTSSCNYRLLVHKENILHKRTGYLVLFNRNAIFYPAKNIKGDNFFTDRIKGPGYLITFSDWIHDETVLYLSAEKYVIDYEYLQDNSKIFVRDTIKVIPVETTSRPVGKDLKSRTVPRDFIIRYNNKLHNFPYAGTNNESLWTIDPILEKDIHEAREYYYSK